MSSTKPIAERRIIHALICGVTQSGKTTLAHSMACEESAKKKDKREIIVYDPVGTETKAGNWPNGSIYFDDSEKFLVYLAKYKGDNALVFIDEADDILAHRYPENSMIVRRGRHFGWQCVLITQRPHLISPSARTQCGVCFMFRLAIADAKAIGADFGHNNVHDVGLDQGDFLVLHSGQSKIERSNIFTHSKGVLKWMDSDTTSKSRSR